eukprot:TRINITY_DN72892_c0_g1_i1.p1 TRINITY_DN72892_c0_g1~~TRINITY_DN72892_c0_g1_i1.p1  ORF type:complete len:480 (-),score=113.97 TRINITY_DN72892_c0_g1_i1:56-1495(-)
MAFTSLFIGLLALSHVGRTDALQKHQVDWNLKNRGTTTGESSPSTPFEATEALAASADVQQALRSSEIAADDVESQLAKVQASVEEDVRQDHETAQKQEERYEDELNKSRAFNANVEDRNYQIQTELELLRRQKAGLFMSATVLNETNAKLVHELDGLWRNLSVMQDFLDRALKNSTTKQIRDAPELSILKNMASKERNATDFSMFSDAFGSEALSQLTEPATELGRAAQAAELATEDAANASQRVSGSIAAMVQMGRAVGVPSVPRVDTLKLADRLASSLAAASASRHEEMQHLMSNYESELNATKTQGEALMKEQERLLALREGETAMISKLEAAVSHLESVHQEMIKERSAIETFLEDIGVEALPVDAGAKQASADSKFPGLLSRAAFAKMKVAELEKWADETASAIRTGVAKAMGYAGGRSAHKSSEGRFHWTDAVSNLREKLGKARATAAAIDAKAKMQWGSSDLAVKKSHSIR